jgi:hypothetical protein
MLLQITSSVVELIVGHSGFHAIIVLETGRVSSMARPTSLSGFCSTLNITADKFNRQAGALSNLEIMASTIGGLEPISIGFLYVGYRPI